MTARKDEKLDATAMTQKPYEPPRLVEYGSIAKLTQGSATVGNDAGAGFRNMACL
jgi:hypothetical protein